MDIPVKKGSRFGELSTVESQRNELLPEEFPEGPYGSDALTESLGKSSPWRPDQTTRVGFLYENRELHEGIDRDYPPEHETHDEPGDESPVG